MNTRFKSRRQPVARYELTFETEEGYLEAFDRIKESGFLLFQGSEERNLVGRFVRADDLKRKIEVDASQEFPV